MDNKEEWRLVEGTEDYFISSRGRFKHGKKLMKVSVGVDGYPRCNVGKLKKRIHRLVAEAFIPNPDDLPIVDHIDGNKKNNNVENLRWVTHQQNVQYAYDTGLYEKAYEHRDKSVGVIDAKKDLHLFDTIIEAAEYAGVTVERVSNCLRGLKAQKEDMMFVRINDIIEHRVKKG